MLNKNRLMVTGIKTGGHTKVTPTSNTVETRNFIQNVVNNQLTWIEDLLAELTPVERMDAIIKLLAFIVPKQSEISTPDTAPSRIKITVKGSEKKDDFLTV